jgi:hypothetical protein
MKRIIVRRVHPGRPRIPVAANNPVVNNKPAGSKIVNNGIQQGGIENAVPIAIRQSEMNKLLIFMNSDSQKMVLTGYTLINSSSPNYSSYLKTYPVLATEPVYVLKSIDSTEINKLNPVLGRGFLIVSSIQQILADPAKAVALAASLGIDLSSFRREPIFSLYSPICSLLNRPC